LLAALDDGLHTFVGRPRRIGNESHGAAAGGQKTSRGASGGLSLPSPTAQAEQRTPRLRQQLQVHSWRAFGNIAARVTLWITHSATKLPADPASGPNTGVKQLR
jgi:hypothetical protein